jgi:hypothetical protein
MKRTFVALATLLAVSVAAPAFARQAAPPATAKPEAAAAPTTDPKLPSSYAGKWTMDVQSPQGAMQLGLDVKIDKANVVTGMLTGGPSGDTAIKGEFKDSKLGFGISFDAGGQMLEVWFEGTLKDGKLAGNASVADQSFTWSAARPKGL